MGIIAKVSTSVHALFGTMTEEVARNHPVVLRHRKFTTTTLAQTFILGFLAKPRASDEELAQTAAFCGVEVTTQAIEQRHTTRMAEFLEALFRRATQCVVKSSGAIDAVAIEPGRGRDYKTSLQSAPLTPGSLRITDLGYFDTEVFQRFDQEGVFWLSRLQFGTSVLTRGVFLNLGSMGSRSRDPIDPSTPIAAG